MIPRFEHEYTLADLLFSLNNRGTINSTSNISNYFGAQKVYYTNYARTGLKLLLKALGRNGKAKVGIQPFTCHTVLEAIKSAGCTFSFIDIDDSYTIDVNDLQKKINTFDILIITHTFGLPANVNKIREIAKGKHIIEDCAHAFLSKYNGISVGKFGDAAIFSSGYGKFPSIGPGGYMIINNDSLQLSFNKFYNALAQVDKNTGIREACKNFIYSLAYKKYIYGLITFPILKKLDTKYDFMNKKNFAESRGYASNVNLFNKNFIKYNSVFQKKLYNTKLFFEELPLAKPNINMFAEPNYYVLPQLNSSRDKIVDFLLKNGVESGKHFSKSIYWAREYGYVDGSCPNTEKIANTIYTIPIHSYLQTNEIKRIAALLKSVL